MITMIITIMLTSTIKLIFIMLTSSMIIMMSWHEHDHGAHDDLHEVNDDRDRHDAHHGLRGRDRHPPSLTRTP